MKLDKAALAKGDPAALLALARTIKPSRPLSKAENPLASQFFDDEPSGVRQLDTQTLIENLAGGEGVEHDRWVESMAAAGYAGIALNRPKASGDVTELTAYNGGGRSGWTPNKDVPIVSGAKAASGRLEKAIADNKAAKATSPSSNILTEQLKSIIFQLLGVSADTYDAPTLKAKLLTALKKAEPGTIEHYGELLASNKGKWVRSGHLEGIAI
jgi:hypothetical protein